MSIIVNKITKSLITGKLGNFLLAFVSFILSWATIFYLPSIKFGLFKVIRSVGTCSGLKDAYQCILFTIGLSVILGTIIYLILNKLPQKIKIILKAFGILIFLYIIYSSILT